MKILVTNKTDFKMYNALKLGDVMHFDGRGTYTYLNGEEGAYDRWWLDAMLKSGAFVDVTEDDPLPPVPDSVLYIKDNGSRKLEACIDPGRVLLSIKLDVNRLSGNTLGYGLSPDEALQLAHDIRRMAMQIKRNQKQEQAQ